MEISDPIEDKELEAIRDDVKVQRALSENSIKSQQIPNIISTSKITPLVGTTAILILMCTAFYFLLSWHQIPISQTYIPLAQKILLTIMFISFVLLVAYFIKKIISKKLEDKTAIFNFNRIADLLVGLIIFATILTMIFANWYAALVSFGIISLILGFALQNLITSFFGWLYILIRKPFEVGDRIKIGNVYGDVINVSYIDTTLWEFKGDYLSGDHPSGRIIRFTNSKVFNEYVYNYSWPLFPFIWNELSFFLSYESDFKFAELNIKRVVETEIGEAMVRRVKRFKKILAETPVDELEVNEYPSVILKAHNNTWIEVSVRYLVEPKSAGKVKKLLFDSLMEELKKHPEQIMFPKTNMR